MAWRGFTGFVNGASTAPVMWLPECTVWEPFMEDENGEYRGDANRKLLPGRTTARYTDIALFCCIHDRCSSPTSWLEVTRQCTSSCCQYQPTIYRTLLSMSVS